MKLRIFNSDPRYGRAKLVEPTTLGYLYAAAVVDSVWSPIIMPSSERSQLLQKLKELSSELERDERVVKATVFRPIVRPPTIWFSSYLKQRKRAGMMVPNFDVIVLVQTTSIATAAEVRTTPAYGALLETMRSKAKTLRVMTARNVRRIADVDTSINGLFLFNHFAADDPEMMRELWDYLADWYARETGLANSVALSSLEPEQFDYAIINWARWDIGPVRHFWHQLSKWSFWSYVTVNLERNRAGSMPIYCRLA
jgi:hypothetical protein